MSFDWCYRSSCCLSHGFIGSVSSKFVSGPKPALVYLAFLTMVWFQWLCDHMCADLHALCTLACPKKDNEAAEGSRKHVLWGMVERTGVVLSGEKETWEDLIVCYNYLKEGCSEMGVDLLHHVSSERMNGNGLVLYQEKFRLDIRKKKKNHWKRS